MSFSDNSKKIVVISVLMAILAVFFWSESRIPALTDKAQMGIRTEISAIAFDVVLPVQPDDPTIQRIVYTSINWAYTNWKGMTFGMLLAAGFLSLIRLLTLKPTKNVFLNTLKGAFIGAPLGVCVNCSTPIMQGLYRGGVNLTSVLATLISSPTLNIIVLTMSFSLLPVELATAKLLAVLIFIFLFIPLITRNQSLISERQEQELLKEEGQSSFLLTEDLEDAIQLSRKKQSWLRIFKESLQEYGVHILFIAKIALPYMLLAGVLGSAMIELVPLEKIQTLDASFLNVVLVAFFGTFLPVPIAMDVLLVSTLVPVGLNAQLTGVLVFTLGSFSVYPFLVIWRDISRRIALSLFVGIMCVGILTGYLVDRYQQFATSQISQTFQKEYKDEIKLERLIDQVCVESGTNPESVRCKRAYINHRLEGTRTDEFCHEINQEAYKAYCFEGARYLNAVYAAIDSGDLTECEKLENSASNSSCKKKVVQRLISNGASLTNCDNLDSDAEISSCQFSGYLNALVQYKDASICSDLTGKLAGQCYKMAEILEYTRGSNFEDCLVLDSAKEINICQSLTAEILLNSTDSGKEVCSVLKNSGDKKKCLLKAVKKQALAENKLDLCDSIDEVRERAQCRKAITNNIIDEKIVRATFQKTGGLRLSKSTGTDIKNVSREVASVVQARQWHTVSASQGLTVSYFEFEEGNVGHQVKQFSRHSLADYGISLPATTYLDLKLPFLMGRGVASGDVNGDSWPDIVYATRQGLSLYVNNGQNQFIERPLDHITATQHDYQLVALVDIDNDGWKDIYFAGYGGLNYFVLNDQNLFQNGRVLKVENDHANLSFATGFGDLDGNGYLDFLLGNWSFGDTKNFISNYSRNELYLNTASSFERRTLDGQVVGETLSVLMSDINNDQLLDIYVANDVAKPDQIYLGGRDSMPTKAKPGSVVPVTAFNTMSVDTADINNDLELDIFSVDMSFSGENDQSYCEDVGNKQDEQYCLSLIESLRQSKLGNIDWCGTLPDAEQKNQCMVMMVRDHAIKMNNQALCDQLPASYDLQKKLCTNISREDEMDESFPIFSEIKQEQSNKLLLATGQGEFIDATNEFGVAKSFWSWNAKFSDLDNDGWQDVYIGNGYGFGADQREVHSNVFFHNENGQGFKSLEREFGLENYASTPAYTYIDIDLDGDIDLVTSELITKGSVYINNNIQGNNAISVSLQDQRGNYDGIGAKVIIYYGEKHQIRELKLSGGFLSFDSPIAHFGLGQVDRVDRMKIIWPDGSVNMLDEDLMAGRHYRIGRLK